MKIVIESSRLTRPEAGWFIGRLNGRAAYGDGCAIFAGEVAEKDANKNKADKFSMKLEDEPFRKTKIIGGVRLGGTSYVIFPGLHFMRKAYADEARLRFRNVKFYRRDGHVTLFVCKKEDRIVAVILPSTPDRAEDYGPAQIKTQPREVAA